jgi:ABC-type lipoprotein release transport system permease subunit
VRLAPRLSSSDIVPIVLSQSLAESTAATVGDLVSLLSIGNAAPVRAVVVEVIEVVPSAPASRSLLIDLGVVRGLQFAAIEPVPLTSLLWISSDDSSATAEAARELLPAGSRVNDATERALRSALGSAVVALWMTAAGSAALAFVVIGSSARAQHRSRRPEVAVLRALGLSARRQGAVRSREIILAATVGVLGGVGAGAVAVSFAVVPFARSALPADVTLAATPLAVDFSAGAIAIAGLVLGLVVIALATALRVSRDARSANAAEVDR